MQVQTDDELILNAIQNNKDAFEILVLRHRQAVVSFAASFVGPFLADDMAQEAFAKVYLRLESYKMGTSFKSWLFSITRNTCLDYLRKQHDTLPLDAAYNLPSHVNAPQVILDNKEEWHRLQQGWDKLSEEARCALYLYAYENMPYADIAQTMGKTTAGVKMTIHRARTRLRKEMAEA